MRRKLTIELLSDTCPSSGLGHAGVIDRDFVADKCGLPFLPGRRLKGLLRDAYVDVAHYKPGLPTPDELFGKGGASVPARLDIGDARIENYTRLYSWLIAAGAGRDATVFRNDVIEAYSTLRRQNAHDRRTGATMEDCLRITRFITAGLIFQVAVRFPDDQVKGFSYAAKALKQMGASRTRGPGLVRCRLSENQEAPNSITGIPTIQAGRLHFRIRLERPAILPHAAGDPNTIVSRDYLPGSALLGLFASNLTSAPHFYETFFGGTTRFLNAYPVSGGQRCIPTPNVVRQVKGSSTEFVNVAAGWGTDPLRRVGGWCQGSILTDSILQPTEVTIGFSYHHQRSDDRRVGRAIGAEPTQRPSSYESASPGAFFGYEAIEEGQEFEGVVLGADGTLRELVDSLHQLGTDGLRLGRSRNAGYGGNLTWTWLGSPENVREANGREITGWQGGPNDVENENDPEVSRFMVTLLSPVSWFNECGHPCPVFPWGQLQKKLGTGIDPEKTFARTRLHGGFLSHQQMQRQQLLCLEMGSAFLVTAEKPLKLSFLRSAESESYGARTEEGYGRIAIDPVPKSALSLHAQSFSKPTDASLSGPNDQAYPLAKMIFQSALLTRAKYRARTKAAEDAPQGLRTPASQLSRLLQIVNSNDVGGALSMVRNLKETSRKRLGRIHEAVSDYLSKPGELYRALHDEVFNHHVWKWNEIFKKTGSPCAETDEQVIRTYLITYLRTLIEDNRTEG